MTKRFILNVPAICAALAALCLGLIGLDAATGNDSANDILTVAQIRWLAAGAGLFGLLAKSPLVGILTKVLYGDVTEAPPSGAVPSSEMPTPNDRPPPRS